jgi:putative hemolysin
MESDGLPGFVRAVSKLFSSKNHVTEEEILNLVNEGGETGIIEEQAHKMINNVFEFDDLPASGVMTHRTDIAGVSSSALVSEVVGVALDTGYSRIPVYEESIDRIVGVICVKDLLSLIGAERAGESDIKPFVREIIYLPETLSCREVFKRLAAKKMQMAVIIDEYGGTAGLLTMEDVVEAIVGSIQDEYDEEEEEFTRESDGSFSIGGAASPDAILPLLGLERAEADGFDTMSGFVVDLLGRIPEEGEHPEADYKGVKFTVLVTEDMRITKIKAAVVADSTKG